MRTRFLESLRARLMLLVAFALIPAIALTAYTAIEQRQMQTEHVEQSNLRVARLLAADQDQLGEQARQVLVTLHLSHADDWDSPRDCLQALERFHGELPYDNLGVYDAHNTLVCSLSPPTPGIRTHVELARASGVYQVGAYDIDEVRQVSSLAFALPLRDADGEPAGTLFSTARADWFTRAAGASTLPEGSIAMLLDGDGRVVARMPDDGTWVGRGIAGAPLHDGMLAHGEGVMTVTDEDGVDRIFAFTPLEGGSAPAYVAVGVPQGPALAGAYAAFARDLATLVVVGAFAFGAAWVVSDVYILRHMRRLIAVTLRLRSGVMTARSGIPRGHGEFSQLAKWFDEMAASLEREHEELRRLGRLELYKLLAENATDLISRLTPEGSILYASPAAKRLLGYTPEVMPGRFLTGLTHHDDLRATRDALAKTLKTGEHVTITHRLRRRDGAFVWVETTAQGVRDERGMTTEVIAVSRDVTERMRVQEELENARRASEAAAQAKSEFLANMSHEIRTPMNAVIGMTSLLSETELDEEQREFVDTVRSSGDHLLTIINDILDFSKIESQRLELEHHAFDLRSAVEESLDLVSGAAAQKGVELAYDMHDGVPEAVVGDAGRLRQVLVNLLSNAVKFTERGEVVVTLASTTLPGGNHEVQVSVRDTGIGIPADRVDRLFQPFSQVDASTTRHYGGSGLGLAISKHLCELMGGRIWVESEAGSGSTFHFTCVVEPTDELPERAPRVDHPAPAIAGRRALVVDDNATNRRLLTLQLERWGMIPLVADGPEAALALVDRGDVFDVALLDLRMPGMSGVELAAAMRRRRPQDDTPLVLLTSIGRAREALRDPHARFAATLSKPVKPHQLHDVLARVLHAADAASAASAAAANGAPRAPSSGTAAAEGSAGARALASVGVFDAGMARRHPLRILLAEDNTVNQKVATRMLARMGYSADVAANGVEALDALERQRYDLVLMDVQMPEMDGLEAARRIRAKWGGKPRIVAMTAHASAQDRDACLVAGMDAYVTKPIHVDQLVAALEKTPAAARTRRTPPPPGAPP